MKKKIGELYGTPIVEGSENQITKNEIYAKGNKDSISLAKRINGEMTPITGSGSDSGVIFRFRKKDGKKKYGEYREDYELNILLTLMGVNDGYWNASAKIYNDEGTVYPAFSGRNAGGNQPSDWELESDFIYLTDITFAKFLGSYGEFNKIINIDPFEYFKEHHEDEPGIIALLEGKEVNTGDDTMLCIVNKIGDTSEKEIFDPIA